MLRSFLETEKATRKDDRPLQYVDERDISAFGPNTSMMGDQSVRYASRSASRSPIRLSKNNSATFSTARRSNSRSTRPMNKVFHTA